MMKVFVLAVLAAAVSAAAAYARALDAAGGPVVRVDWQAPEQLTPRFGNHCTAENFTSRPYCSGHCGIDHQFYYCSKASFGCCHLGHGYCDWNGVLRCHP